MNSGLLGLYRYLKKIPESDPHNGTLCIYSALSNAASFGHAATPRKDRGDKSRAEDVFAAHYGECCFQSNFVKQGKQNWQCVTATFATGIMPGSQNAHEYPGYSVITQFLADFWPAALVITDVGVCSMVTATLCSCDPIRVA